MSYFNHAFQKCFYTDRILGDTAKKTKDMAIDGNATSMYGGLFKSTDYTNLALDSDFSTYAPATVIGGKAKFLIATQSPRGSNLTGAAASTNFQMHGGYDESIKSKDIQMNYINKLGAAASALGVGQTFEFITYGGASSTSCFECGSDPMVRIDLKGSDALRMLGHNAYRQFDIGAKCNCCGDDGDYLDPWKVMAMIAKNIADDPILGPLLDTTASGVGATTYFATTVDAGANWVEVTYANLDAVACAATWDANRGAAIRIKPAVVDTEWGNCSWNPTDFTNYQPLLAHVEVLDESGNSCDTCLSTTYPLGAATFNNGAPSTLGQIIYNGDNTTGAPLNAVVPISTVGGGSDIFSELILSDAYMQNAYNFGNKDSSRFRQVEQADKIWDVTLASRTAYLYKTYFLTHSVPRYNNPTGVFDNDQYHYKIFVPERNSAGVIIPDGSYGEGDSPIDGGGGTAGESWNALWVQLATNSGIAQTTI